MWTRNKYYFNGIYRLYPLYFTPSILYLLMKNTCWTHNDDICRDSKVDVVNMGPNWVLSALEGRHVGSMNLAIRVVRVCVCGGGGEGGGGGLIFQRTFGV